MGDLDELNRLLRELEPVKHNRRRITPVKLWSHIITFAVTAFCLYVLMATLARVAN